MTGYADPVDVVPAADLDRYVARVEEELRDLDAEHAALVSAAEACEADLAREVSVDGPVAASRQPEHTATRHIELTAAITVASATVEVARERAAQIVSQAITDAAAHTLDRIRSPLASHNLETPESTPAQPDPAPSRTAVGSISTPRAVKPEVRTGDAHRDDDRQREDLGEPATPWIPDAERRETRRPTTADPIGASFRAVTSWADTGPAASIVALATKQEEPDEFARFWRDGTAGPAALDRPPFISLDVMLPVMALLLVMAVALTWIG